MISVIIHTLNEEQNIRNCLECVKWADEIIIIDMHSKDKTVQIAKEYTDKIFFFEQMEYADPARSYGLSLATNEWILSVDADEIVPVDLKNILIKIMKENYYDAVSIPHFNYFFGHAIIGGDCAPLENPHIRFFKKNIVSYSDDIHSFLQIDYKAKIYFIENKELAFIHFGYIDIEHFLEKLNRYTAIEAKALYLNNEKNVFYKLVIKNIKEILKFLFKKGYKDKTYGLIYTLLKCGYNTCVGAKYFLMKQSKTIVPRNSIIYEYNKIAQKCIQEHKKRNKKYNEDKSIN
ncbi:glycosyltransferase family 2 protein [Sporomusa paucivorans]|uniref:glycosyltransferase family 2 protein n=1 Tax=Sporomusa paucivorans TaxID=2376 RepID=UPI003570D3CE